MQRIRTNTISLAMLVCGHGRYDFLERNRGFLQVNLRHSIGNVSCIFRLQTVACGLNRIILYNPHRVSHTTHVGWIMTVGVAT